ncbi:major facilitator superfamily domain-containing protein [Xylariaceae sp. FL1272]|nr:major facilitator superfamily domain-containing protein [Xylariaceae sp. FL1272]
MAVQLPSAHQQSGDGVQQADERTPLVPQPGAIRGSALDVSAKRYQLVSLRSVATVLPQAHSPNAIVAVLCASIFVGSASGGFLNIPMTRIFEDVLCRQYYNQTHSLDGPIDEEMCKVDIIQSRLAYLFAIMAALNAGLSCLVALPWGIAADRIGRRAVFAIGVIGMSMATLWIMVVGWVSDSLSPKLIWLSPIFYMLGGGNPVLAAALQGMVTDVVPESKRSINLMRVHASSMMGNLVSPALASIMMKSVGPWPPLFLSFWMLLITGPMIYLAPESLKHTKQVDNAGDSGDSTLKRRLIESLGELKNSATMFKSPSLVLIAILTMLHLAVVICTYQFMAQFVSKRYHIPLADTGYVQTTYGIAYVGVAFLILPFVSSAVTSPRTPARMRIADERRRDLAFIKTSIVLALFGTFLLGVSPSLESFIFGLVVLSLGGAADSYIRAVATLYIVPEQRSRLFTILGLVAIASDLWISPGLAALFSLGMRLGGVWIGLPYFGVSAICLVMLVLSMFIRLPGTTHKVDNPTCEDTDGERNGLLS